MKLVCLSDTHGQHHTLKVPNGSIIVHTGDFSNRGTEQEVDNFLLWYSELPHKYKLLIAGNHDWYPYKHSERFKIKCALLGITYLYDESTIIEGIKFYGTPWVPTFFDWAFMESEAKLSIRYSKIPKDTQVLLTHGPAHQTLDRVPRGHVGSTALTERLKHIPYLTHHIFGHIHESKGKHKGKYLSINASCVDKWYNTIKPQSIYIQPNLSK